MRRAVVRSALGAAAILVSVSQIGAQPIHQGHAATSDVAVRVTGPFVSLRVIGWSHDSVLVTGSLPSTHRLSDVFTGDPKEPVRAARLYIEGPEGGAMVIKSAILELRVPAGARVWVKGGIGILEVTGVNGELDLNMVGGSVRVSGRPRALNVEAMDASVSITGLAEWSRIKTAAGTIDVSGGGTDAAYTTVSGRIVVRGGAYERGRFESVTGSIVFGAETTPRGTLHFDTHSGGVEVQLSPRSSARVYVETIGGSIENRVSDARPVIRRDGPGHQELSIELGTGAARLVIRTFKGPVAIIPPR